MASVCLPEFTLCTANDQARSLFARHGIDLADGQLLEDVFAREDATSWKPELQRRLAKRSPLWRANRRLRLPAGDETCVELTWIPVPAPNSQPGHLLCYIDECEQHGGAQGGAGDQQSPPEDLEAIVGRLNSTRLLVFDPAGRLVHLGEQVTELFKDPDQVIWAHESDIDWPQPEGVAFVEALHRARTELATSNMLLRTAEQVYHAHVDGYSPNGRPPATLVLALLLPIADDTVQILLPPEPEQPRALRARFDYLQERLQAITEETQRARWLLEPDAPTIDRETVMRGIDELSPREREVYELIADGYRVPTIAKRLFINQSTVRNHLSNVFRKLGVESQAQLLEVIGEHRPRPESPTD